jgi:hypothetical protein
MVDGQGGGAPVLFYLAFQEVGAAAVDEAVEAVVGFGEEGNSGDTLLIFHLRAWFLGLSGRSINLP